MKSTSRLRRYSAAFDALMGGDDFDADAADFEASQPSDWLFGGVDASDAGTGIEAASEVARTINALVNPAERKKASDAAAAKAAAAASARAAGGAKQEGTPWYVYALGAAVAAGSGYLVYRAVAK